MYIDYEKDEFISKMYSWITKMKDVGKTDKRK